MLVPIAAVVLATAACTPEQFQRWWTDQGNPPMAEPQLSEAAEGATRFWDEVARRNRFAATVQPIDAALAARMTPSSWRPGCPVPLTDLRYVRVTHMDYDGYERTGELVVNADAVDVVLAAFKYLWDDGFPIESMRLVDDFGGKDDVSMAYNNTSAFNCRKVAGTDKWSQHATGRAIDINPVQNPYVRGALVQPANGTTYADRAEVHPGMMIAGTPSVNIFEFLGWGWGGRWSGGTKDYMHVSVNGQ
ncbi:MAG: M15 family metallopeptidase [Microthrixaceae bacterium]